MVYARRTSRIVLDYNTIFKYNRNITLRIATGRVLGYYYKREEPEVNGIPHWRVEDEVVNGVGAKLNSNGDGFNSQQGSWVGSELLKI